MTALLLVALLLALAEEWLEHGRSLVAWAVVCIALALVWNDLARLL